MAGWSRGGVGGRYILCEHATIVKIWLLLFLAFVYVLKWKFLWKVEKKEKSSGIDGSMTSSSSWSSNNIHIWNFLVRRKIFCLFLLSLARVCKKAKRSVFDTWFHSNFFSISRLSSRNKKVFLSFFLSLSEDVCKYRKGKNWTLKSFGRNPVSLSLSLSLFCLSSVWGFRLYLFPSQSSNHFSPYVCLSDCSSVV